MQSAKIGNPSIHTGRLLPALALAIGGMTAPLCAEAALYSVTMMGNFNLEVLSDAGGDPYTPTSDSGLSLYPYPPYGSDFTLSFILDDSATSDYSTSNLAIYPGAIHNLSLIAQTEVSYGPGITGYVLETVWQQANADALMAENSNNHQWSIFSYYDASVSSDFSSVDVEDDSLPWGGWLDTLELDRLDLTLLDLDQTLFTQTPPELTAFNGNEFEYQVVEIQWKGTQGLYNYLLGGDISSITITPVPVPAAAWLFGSGLLGMFGAAARRRR